MSQNLKLAIEIAVNGAKEAAASIKGIGACRVRR
jgi:hypothetical protein